MSPADYLAAARCPRSLAPRDFGLWSIQRQFIWRLKEREIVGEPSMTCLYLP